MLFNFVQLKGEVSHDMLLQLSNDCSTMKCQLKKVTSSLSELSGNILHACLFAFWYRIGLQY